MGISEKVVLTGLVESERVPQLLKDAEICVLARPNSLQSLCGFPTKLGEYLLSENPVIITNVGDIPLFLEDMSSALIATPGDVAEFASKIIWTLKHPSEAQLIGKKGYEVAMTNFNASVEVEKMLKIMCI